MKCEIPAYQSPVNVLALASSSSTPCSLIGPRFTLRPRSSYLSEPGSAAPKLLGAVLCPAVRLKPYPYPNDNDSARPGALLDVPRPNRAKSRMGLCEGDALVLVLGCERSPNPPRSRTGPRRDERDSVVVEELPVVCGDSSAASIGDLAETGG